MRLILGLSQSELSKRLEFSAQQLQKYESGKSRINFDTLESISSALNSSVEEVFGHMEDALPSIRTLMIGLETGQNDQAKPDHLYEIIHTLSSPDYKQVKAKLLAVIHAIEATESLDKKCE